LWCQRERLRVSEGELNGTIFVALKTMGFKVDEEVNEAEGRSDLFIALENGKAFVFATKHVNYPENVDKLTPREKNEWEEKTAAKLIAKTIKQIKVGNHGAKYVSEYPEAKNAAMAIAGHTGVTIKFI
jgi:hypothetical protein